MHLIHSLDLIGAIFSFLTTIFYIRAHVIAWPLSVFAVSINLTLYILTGLYVDSITQCVTLIVSLYGWYWWTRPGKTQTTQPITHLSKKHGLFLCVIAFLAACTIPSLLIRFTNSNVPYWDAITGILCLTAQWLTCRKILESWIAWFVVDLLYVGLYFYKDIPAHSMLLMIYLVMAVIGYYQWRRLMRTQSSENDAQSKGFKYRSYKRASSVPDSG